jgi:hypothetical protein
VVPLLLVVLVLLLVCVVRWGVVLCVGVRAKREAEGKRNRRVLEVVIGPQPISIQRSDLPTASNPRIHPLPHHNTTHTARKAMSWIRDRREEEDEAAEQWGLEARAELVQLSKEGSRIKELRAARDACRTGGKVCSVVGMCCLEVPGVCGEEGFLVII